MKFRALPTVCTSLLGLALGFELLFPSGLVRNAWAAHLPQGLHHSGPTPCPPGSLTWIDLQPGADIFVIEGPLEAYDLAERVITVAGTQIQIPGSLLVDNDGDGLGDIPLSLLLDAGLEATQTIIGGSAQVSGHIDALSGCLTYVADVLFVELAEHVHVGPLSSVQTGMAELMVNGLAIQMNSDPRFPSWIRGAGDLPLQVSDLIGFEGSLVEAGGYLQGGVLYATQIESDAFVADPRMDTVIIERASWEEDKQQLSFRGFCSVDPGTGELTRSLDAFLQLNPARAEGCSGTFAVQVTTTINAALGVAEFQFTSDDGAFPLEPAVLCIESPFGGVRSRTIEIEH